MSAFAPSPGRWPIVVRDRWLERDGEPWIPLVGELHYSRLPRHRWPAALAALAAAGLDVVSSYVIWNHHEERQGHLRWDDRRDLRAFLDRADAAGLRVLLRIGPWVHGESRNGGFPDWVADLPGARTNDPEYLAAVRCYLAAIATQVADACAAGIVVGVQVENELYDQPEHLATLRTMAEEAGILAPLWTATGWGRAQFDRARLLPVYGGYADTFWSPASPGWDEHCAVHYRFSPVRDDTTIGSDLRSVPASGVGHENDAATPFASCELGGGMALAYHRRPVIAPADVSALALVKLGSGSVWHGYYMFHGGVQFHGEASALQESQATGYPNDLPLRDYDFQAPVGAAGAVRESYHRLRLLHLSIRSVQAILAPSVVEFAPTDPDGPRYAVRATPSSALVFVNHHQPHATLPERRGVSIPVRVGATTVTVPPQPMTIRPGDHAMLPVLLPLSGGVVLRSASAQPITSVRVAGTTVWFFASIDDEAWFEFEPGAHVDSPGAGSLVRTDARGGFDVSAGAEHVRVEVLDPPAARRLWRSPFHDLVVFSDTPITFARDGLRVATHGGPLRLDTTGELDAAAARRGGWRDAPLPTGHRWRHDAVGPSPRTLTPVLLRPAGTGYRAREAERGKPSAPTTADFVGAAVYELPAAACTGEGILRIRWVGDVLRLGAAAPGAHRGLTDAEVAIDQFFNGLDLEVDPSLLGADPAQVVRIEILGRDLGDERFAWLGSARAELLEVRFISTAGVTFPLPPQD